MDKLIKHALEKHKIVRYIPTFVEVMKTYKSLLDAENEALRKPPVSGSVCADEDLDCPYDFTSRCTMGRCDCKPKQTVR